MTGSSKPKNGNVKPRLFPFALAVRRANINKFELIGTIAMSFRKKVLLVDDGLDAVEAMSLLHELEGYEVRVAGSRARAVVPSRRSCQMWRSLTKRCRR